MKLAEALILLIQRINRTNAATPLQGELTISDAIARRDVLRLKYAIYRNLAQATTVTDEPASHTYYHRPLHELLGQAFAAGLVLDALEEPSFSPEDADPARPLTWSSLWQIPPVLAGRLRPEKAGFHAGTTHRVRRFQRLKGCRLQSVPEVETLTL